MIQLRPEDFSTTASSDSVFDIAVENQQQEVSNDSEYAYSDYEREEEDIEHYVTVEEAQRLHDLAMEEEQQHLDHMEMQMNIAPIILILELLSLLMVEEYIAIIWGMTPMFVVVTYTLTLYFIYQYLNSWVPVDEFIRDEIKWFRTFARMVDFNVQLIRYLEYKWNERKLVKQVLAEKDEN